MMFLKDLLVKVSGNQFAQILLERTVNTAQYLMGIGSGTAVLSSGEHTVFRILKKGYRPPYCVFDIGSNKGQFLQLTLDNIGTDRFSVHCFEPGHESFKSLARFLKGDERVRLNNVGIGKKRGEATLYFDEPGSGLASLTRRRLDHFGINLDKSETAQITTVDSYCTENAINHVHLMKIDVEGHELDVLAGAQGMLTNRAIDIVTFEFGGCNIDTRTFFQDFWYFLEPMDMDIFRITPSGYLHAIRSYKEIYEQFRTANFIAASRFGNHSYSLYP